MTCMYVCMYVLLQKKGNSCMIGRFKKSIIRKREFRKISFMDLMVPVERRGRQISLFERHKGTAQITEPAIPPLWILR